MSLSSHLAWTGVFALVVVSTTHTTHASVAACTASDVPIYGNAAFVDSGMLVKSDGGGLYINGKRKAVVTAQSALNVFPFPAGTAGKAQRHLLVNLNNPVPGGGGVPRGIISSWSGIHSYWYLDSDLHVHGVRDIPIGTTTYSNLTALFISSDDGASAYLLQMGPWAWTTCEDAGPVQTDGSSRAVIARTGARTWSVDAPAGSTGMLHDMHDPQNPIPLGLYYTAFHIDYVF